MEHKWECHYQNFQACLFVQWRSVSHTKLLWLQKTWKIVHKSYGLPLWCIYAAFCYFCRLTAPVPQSLTERKRAEWSFFCVPQKKVVQVWNDMRVRKGWQVFFFRKKRKKCILHLYSGISPPHSVIIYSPCCFKPVWLSFFCWTQIALTGMTVPAIAFKLQKRHKSPIEAL